jgi:hypothetical protein
MHRIRGAGQRQEFARRRGRPDRLRRREPHPVYELEAGLHRACRTVRHSLGRDFGLRQRRGHAERGDRRAPGSSRALRRLCLQGCHSSRFAAGRRTSSTSGSGRSSRCRIPRRRPARERAEVPVRVKQAGDRHPACDHRDPGSDIGRGERAFSESDTNRNRAGRLQDNSSDGETMCRAIRRTAGECTRKHRRRNKAPVATMVHPLGSRRANGYPTIV